MANLDSKQKRMSGINPRSPWRGVMVVPTGTVTKAERQAADYAYSGIAASAPVAGGFFARYYYDMGTPGRV